MTWHTLYLLPSAPLELAETVYRHVSVQLGRAPDAPAVGAALDELRAAHARDAAVAVEQTPRDEPSLERRRPWDLLHVRPDAPPEIVDLAYRYWSERVLGRPVEVVALPAPPPDVSVREHVAPALAAPAVAAPVVTQSAFPCLRRASGDALPLGGRPLRIGGDPTCDVVVGAPGAEARVWVNDGRAVLHGLGASAVLVNGEPAGWCVLEDGDTLQVAGETFKFEGC